MSESPASRTSARSRYTLFLLSNLNYLSKEKSGCIKNIIDNNNTVIGNNSIIVLSLMTQLLMRHNMNKLKKKYYSIGSRRFILDIITWNKFTYP